MKFLVVYKCPNVIFLRMLQFLSPAFNWEFKEILYTGTVKSLHLFICIYKQSVFDSVMC